MWLLPWTHDFIELSVNGFDDVSMAVELPLRAVSGTFDPGFRYERTLRSLAEVEEWVGRYFALSPEELRDALEASDVSHR